MNKAAITTIRVKKMPFMILIFGLFFEQYNTATKKNLLFEFF
jgi:hypothetical protein